MVNLSERLFLPVRNFNIYPKRREVSIICCMTTTKYSTFSRVQMLVF